MKRLVVLVLCLVLMGGSLFAMDMVFGGGIMYNHSTTVGQMTNVYDYDSRFYYDFDWSLTRNGFGGFVFFGFNKYIELNLGFLYKNPDEMKMTVTALGYTETVTEDFSDLDLESTGALQFGAYFKYPIPLSDNFVFFPTVGLDMEITTGSNNAWWNDIWLRGGIGLDIFFSERFFLRGQVLYGYEIPFGDNADFLGLDYGHGALIKVGLGWMF